MWVIAAYFAYAPSGCTRRAYMRFLLIFQEIGGISKTRNRFTKSCQDAPLLAVGRNGILVRGFGGQIPPT